MSLVRLMGRVWTICRDDGLRSAIDAVREFLHVMLIRLYYVVSSRVRQFRYRAEFGGSTPEPYKIIYIKPEKVARRIYPYPGVELSEYGTYILDGDWDVRQSEKTVGYTPSSIYMTIPLEGSLFFSTVESWLTDGVEWENMDWYELDAERLSVSKADERKEKIQELHDSISDGNYKSQAELSKEGIFTIQRTALLPYEHYEVEIGIGRSGEIFFLDGKHRFSLAKYTEIDYIPVRILLRHQEWQELRQEIHTATGVSDLSPKARSHLSHPDMQDVIGDNFEGFTDTVD